MFERFTERARQVVVLSQQAAREMRHNYIGTEHILLGLLLEEDGLAARVLEGSFDLTADHVRGDIERMIGLGTEAVPEGTPPAVVSGQIPFTPRAKKCLELALREALSLGHNYIGTEHILLGLASEGEGVGMRILLERELDAEKLRNEVIRILSGPGARRSVQSRLSPVHTLPRHTQEGEDIARALELMDRLVHADTEIATMSVRIAYALRQGDQDRVDHWQEQFDRAVLNKRNVCLDIGEFRRRFDA